MDETNIFLFILFHKFVCTQYEKAAYFYKFELEFGLSEEQPYTRDRPQHGLFPRYQRDSIENYRVVLITLQLMSSLACNRASPAVYFHVTSFHKKKTTKYTLKNNNPP